MTAEGLKNAIEDRLRSYYGTESARATDEQLFDVCAQLVREDMSRRLSYAGSSDGRQVHYLSMEFLLGRSLMKNAFNMGLAQVLGEALRALGREPSEIFEKEPDAGLGNGGLGRLAACYMDSAATLDIPATGYSICYELGIFRQKIVNGEQKEEADNWLELGENWLVPGYDDIVEVRFGGRLEPYWDHSGNYVVRHTDYTTVLALPRDMLISGYGTNRVNRLRLWEARSPKSLDMYLFSGGQYVRSLEERTMAEVITKVLYPADDHMEGKKLRIKQQYFFVSATAQDIVRKDAAKYGGIAGFRDRHAIQINDTHPALIIPELMRIFMDEYGLGWDAAWQEVCGSVAYTNHTVMSEALERWPQGLIQSLLPRVWEIICEIDRRRLASGGRGIVRDGQVHMAELCLTACRKINGVSQLHGEILKNDLFREECQRTPERFLAITNGVDHRRWLAQINPELHKLICGLLGGDDYLRQPERLRELEKYLQDNWVLDCLRDIKQGNKRRFAQWLRRQGGPGVDPNLIFDVQIKRLHEYKRQLLCVMGILALRNRLRDDPHMDFAPRCFLFGAKAASSYQVAKRIIQLIHSVARDVAEDPACRGRLQVVFVENYRVTVAEQLIPAAEVSEQISTAGKEASGTGNMKLMMNGAVTIGTLDGANVEMCQALGMSTQGAVGGEESLFLFGARADEAAALRRGGYDPQRIARENPELRRVLDQMNAGFADGGNYADLVSRLLYGGDEYLLLRDFADYMDAQSRLYRALTDGRRGGVLALKNIAASGVFAADRAVREYAEKIWMV